MIKTWNAEEIRDFRKRLGLYQKDFAELVGVTRLYVVYLEKGVRQPSRMLRILLSMMEAQVNEKGKEVLMHGKNEGNL